MKIVITGSTGLIGSALVPQLQAKGGSVTKLVRGEPQSSEEVHWEPESGRVDPKILEGADAIFHLGGETILGRWSKPKKQRIYDSRVISTRALAEAITKLDAPPKFWGCASAVGYYGDRGDEVLTEQSASGNSFLADVCRDWESATEPANAAGVRVTHFRIGPVLSADGGALKAMLFPFKLGLGGKISSGQQWMSWIAIDDILGSMLYALENSLFTGPVNLTAPNPVTNEEFTHTLGKVLSRPTILRTPAVDFYFALGKEATQEMLLSSARVVPEALTSNGYKFQYPDLEGALKHLLKL